MFKYTTNNNGVFFWIQKRANRFVVIYVVVLKKIVYLK